MTKPWKRPLVQSQSFSFRLSGDELAWLAEESARRERTVSELVREALGLLRQVSDGDRPHRTDPDFLDLHSD